MFLPSAHDEAPARNRETSTRLSLVAWLHANYLPLSLDPHWWSCATARRKISL